MLDGIHGRCRWCTYRIVAWRVGSDWNIWTPLLKFLIFSLKPKHSLWPWHYSLDEGKIPALFSFASTNSPLLLPWKHPFPFSSLLQSLFRWQKQSMFWIQRSFVSFLPNLPCSLCLFKIKTRETQSNPSLGCVVKLKHSSTVLLSQECEIVQEYCCESTHLLCSLLKTIFQEAGQWRKGCSSKRVRQQNRTTCVGGCCLDGGWWI